MHTAFAILAAMPVWKRAVIGECMACDGCYSFDRLLISQIISAMFAILTNATFVICCAATVSIEAGLAELQRFP